MNSLISIVVPIYNVEKELPKCIDSLINQTYTNIEIILVDDGSSDNCPLICDKYKDRDKRIVVLHKKNGGLSDARNAGLKIAHGEYVMYVDSDDYLENNACMTLASGMLDSSVDFVVGSLREVHGNKITYQKHSNIEPGKKIAPKKFIKKSIEANEWFAPAVLNLYRREFLIENGLFYKKGRFYEDMEMLPRLYLSATTIVYIDNVFYNYIQRENSIMTSTINKEKTQHAFQNYTEWKKLFDSVDDIELKNCLYGFLVRCYLKTCRMHSVTRWCIQGVDSRFALRYSLGIKEKIKTLFFTIAPQIFVGVR